MGKGSGRDWWVGKGFKSGRSGAVTLSPTRKFGTEARYQGVTERRRTQVGPGYHPSGSPRGRGRRRTTPGPTLRRRGRGSGGRRHWTWRVTPVGRAGVPRGGGRVGGRPLRGGGGVSSGRRRTSASHGRRMPGSAQGRLPTVLFWTQEWVGGVPFPLDKRELPQFLYGEVLYDESV